MNFHLIRPPIHSNPAFLQPLILSFWWLSKLVKKSEYIADGESRNPFVPYCLHGLEGSQLGDWGGCNHFQMISFSKRNHTEGEPKESWPICRPGFCIYHDQQPHPGQTLKPINFKLFPEPGLQSSRSSFFVWIMRAHFAKGVDGERFSSLVGFYFLLASFCLACLFSGANWSLNADRRKTTKGRYDPGGI